MNTCVVLIVISHLCFNFKLSVKLQTFNFSLARKSKAFFLMTEMNTTESNFWTKHMNNFETQCTQRIVSLLFSAGLEPPLFLSMFHLTL